MTPSIFHSGANGRVADIIHSARGQSDWELVESVYRQCSEIVGDKETSYLPDKLVSFLAEALWRVSASYYQKEEAFILHALAVLGNVEQEELLTPSLFRRLYQDASFERFARYAPRGVTKKRRRPRPFESLVETARRLRDANLLGAALDVGASSGVLGGSTSYGRFFNVCGPRERDAASDLDFMIILPTFGTLLDAVASMKNLACASAMSLENLSRRATLFVTSGLDDGRTIFSHKLNLWHDIEDSVMKWAELDGKYSLSLHFLSKEVLEYLLVDDSTKLSGTEAGHHRSVSDYREQNISRNDHQRSFSGRNQHLHLPVDQVEGGYVRRSRVYVIDSDDRYYPGMFQNMLLPRFDLRWDRSQVERKLQVFKWKIIERIRYERRIRPHEFLRVSLAHTRSEVFAPHVLDMIDTGLTSA